MPKIPFWVFMLIGILYFSSIRVDTMDIDASQYASMSRELLSSHNWLQLYDHGLEYLDKPPFLFWISALSMKIFGAGNLGYKLPSLLFALWSLYATYRLGKLLYNDTTGRMAALILTTCQGMFLMTNDVRCDTILLSWVVTAVWLIKEWDITRKLHYLLLAAACIGFGMMTKGPIALMVPVFSFAADWALKREWKKFFHPAYLLGLIIIAVVLLPMSIGLYQQFDLHPEKLVNGAHGVSGLRFFYWSQSFGRITGESPWKNDVDLSFLLSNMLWSYLPWVFILIPAIIINCMRVFRQKFRLNPGQEAITTGGFVLAYLALGSSSYQLPHYIFVAFPLASVIVAKSIAGFLEKGDNKLVYKIIRPFFFGITLLILGIVFVLITYVFPAGIVAVGWWFVGLVVWFYLALSKKLDGKVLWLPAIGMIIANVFLTNCLYYTLLQYQVGNQAGRYIKEQHIPPAELISYKMRDPLNSLDFYADAILPSADTLVNISGKKYVLTMDEGKNDLLKAGRSFKILKQGDLFKVSELTPEFLNPATRSNTLRRYYVLKME